MFEFMVNKTLVTFYSRSGHTKSVGQDIAKALKADIEEIIDLKNRSRMIICLLIAGRDAILKKLTEIKYKKDPTKYDLVIIGTPVWACTMTPAIRTYLTKNKFKKVAFFCTSAGQDGKTIQNMEELSKKAVTILSLIDRELGESKSKKKLESFCKKLKK